jgi:hypothetical protein
MNKVVGGVMRGGSQAGASTFSVPTTETELDLLLYRLQIVIQQELGLQREALAKRIALNLNSRNSWRDLIDAWRTEPSLMEFASAVARTMLPV